MEDMEVGRGDKSEGEGPAGGEEVQSRSQGKSMGQARGLCANRGMFYYRRRGGTAEASYTVECSVGVELAQYADNGGLSD